MRWSILLLAPTMITLAGCGTGSPAPAGEFCRIYQPIYDSAADTPGTRAQVLRENAKYECLCDGDCPG